MNTKLRVCYTCVGCLHSSHACSLGGGSVPVSPYRFRLVNFVDFLVVTLTSLVPSIPLPPLLQDDTNISNVTKLSSFPSRKGQLVLGMYLAWWPTNKVASFDYLSLSLDYSPPCPVSGHHHLQGAI